MLCCSGSGSLRVSSHSTVCRALSGIPSEHWTPENGMTTSTMKLRRRVITKHYLALIEELYANNKA